METINNKVIIENILVRFGGRTLDELENYVSSVLADLYRVKEGIQNERAHDGCEKRYTSKKRKCVKERKI